MTAVPAPVPVPRYGDAALSDLLPSVLASLGVAGEPATIALPPARRTVLLLVDGMGLELLQRHTDVAPFLSGLQRSALTTGFPATTATSLSSIGTGLAPGEHGITGYTSWVAEVDGAVGWLTWTLGREDLRERLVPERSQPRPTVFERAERAGVAVTVAAPAVFEGSGLTRAVLRGGTYLGAVTPGDSVAHAVAGSRRGDRSLVYCYTPDLDLIGHVRGTDSDAWLSQLALVDRYAEELAGRLPADTALLVTADHGMVDVPPGSQVDFDASPALQHGVRALAGEPRARHVHVEDGAARDVLATWQAELGDRMAVLTREQVIAAGLLGPVVTPAASDRTGDVVAIATCEVAVVRREHERLLSGLRGQHGALTDAERLVPLLRWPAPPA
ncbi:MAG: putative phosphodiesterase [Frankiales bacterium]|nr:putative phosphodiesterase [Frankiales bacterium]